MQASTRSCAHVWNKRLCINVKVYLNLLRILGLILSLVEDGLFSCLVNNLSSNTTVVYIWIRIIMSLNFKLKWWCDLYLLSEEIKSKSFPKKMQRNWTCENEIATNEVWQTMYNISFILFLYGTIIYSTLKIVFPGPSNQTSFLALFLLSLGT